MMRPMSYADSYEVLCLQAASDGRGEVLFGDCLERARKAMRPFMVGEKFPSVYLEFPLAGDPFLDVTVLYSKLGTHARIESDTVRGMERALDWFSGLGDSYSRVNLGFELDVGNPSLPAAAVHFQPREHRELVRPFCEAIGEPERAQLYESLARRMPKGWPLSFFGLFRGRPGTPMRVCGYVDRAEQKACAADPSRLARAFDEVGFCAYDTAMLEQVCALLDTAPCATDFQFDVYPNGQIGTTFAIDASFAIEQPHAVRASFENGPDARLMRLLEKWGIADGRWRLVADAAFARSIPVELDDGSVGRFAFTLMPQWVKARWRDGVLQPAKLYHLGGAGLT
ncbi:MAG: hypothetical protein Q4A07_02290 [Coriobacteriales bacterium]|nr:hypothetical protein [Coriobacteriales bacterium]